MKERNHGVEKLPAIPATIPNALSALLLYMTPTDAGGGAVPPAGSPAPAVPAATTAPATGSVSFDDASLKALQNLAAASAAAATKPDPIMLGNSKVADGGTLRRSGFFSASDVSAFEEHEARLTALSEVPKGEELAFTAALHELPESARDLLAVPVNPADMAKNQRLLVLQVLQLRQRQSCLIRLKMQLRLWRLSLVSTYRHPSATVSGDSDGC